MSVIHRAGRLHANADALSCITCSLDYCVNYKAGVPLSSLPCFSAEKPYKFCMRTEEKWSQFERDVDYVVRLSVKQLQVGPEYHMIFLIFGCLDILWVIFLGNGWMISTWGLFFHGLNQRLRQLSVNLLWRVLRFDITGSWVISKLFRMVYFSINGQIFWSLVCYWLYHTSCLRDEVLYMNHDSRDSG